MSDKPDVEIEEPYLIDPGSEDPGSSIEQILPPPQPPASKEDPDPLTEPKP